MSSLGAAVIYVDQTASGGNTGADWVNAYQDLQSALASSVSGDEIWVAASGNYIPHASDRTVSFSVPGNVSLFGGFVGNEVNINDRNFSNNPTVISGDIGGTSDTDNSYNIFYLNHSAGNVTIDGFIIENGYNDNGVAPQHGAAIFAANSDVILRNNVFLNNKATNASAHGGAIYIDSTTTNQNLIENCVFESNYAYRFGGAIYSYRPLEVNNCVFYDNSTGNEDGGAVGGQGSGIIFDFAHNTFVNNYSFRNGGVAFIYDNSDWLFSNCIFWGNGAGTAGNTLEISTATGNIEYSLIQGSPSGAYDGANGLDGGNNIDSDPMFLDINDPIGPDGKYFTGDDGLGLSSSPAIDVGANLNFMNDISGNPRDVNPDLGAYEYGTMGGETT